MPSRQAGIQASAPRIELCRRLRYRTAVGQNNHTMFSVPTWILTGTVAIGARAIMSPYQKHLLGDASESEVLLVRDTVALGLLLPVVVWTGFNNGFSGTPRSTVAMILTGLLNVVGAFMIFIALSREDASVVIPLSSLSPIITALIEPLLRETPVTSFVIAGAVLSACGVAIVNSEKNTLSGVLHASDTTAVLLALSANVVFGITSTLDGIATTTISPFYVSIMIILCVSAGSAGQLWRNGTFHRRERYLRLWRLYRADKGMLGILQFGGLTATLFTFGAAPTAAQASILFQTSIILVVIVSNVALGEDYLRRRIVGAALIALGVGFGVTG